MAAGFRACARAARLLTLFLGIAALAGQAGAQGAGITPAGQKGRLHVVKKGDTLWDITALYLGTPWIWPSVWIENDDIANPHRIYPGDLIWIADGKMRKVTPEEAAALLAAQEEEGTPAAAATETPGEKPDPFSSLDVDTVRERRRLHFEGLDHVPFVTEQELDASGAVIGSHEPHYWLSQEDQIIIGMGEGQVHAGDRFSIFRVRRRVQHPVTHEPVGYFVDVVGRGEVTEVHPETSFARVVHAYSEIQPGDRLAPYQPEDVEFTPVQANRELKGTILAQQPNRTWSGAGDVVVLDQGSDGGLAIGNELVVYREGKLVPDPLSGDRVMIPDDVIGRVFVLKSSATTAVGLIIEARTEIAAGDRFRNP